MGKYTWENTVDEFIEHLVSDFPIMKMQADSIAEMLEQFKEKLDGYNSMDLNLEYGDDIDWENYVEELQGMLNNTIDSIVVYYSWEEDVCIEPYESAPSNIQPVIDEFIWHMVNRQIEVFTQDYYDNIRTNDDYEDDDYYEDDEAEEDELDESFITRFGRRC